MLIERQVGDEERPRAGRERDVVLADLGKAGRQ